MVFSKKMVFFFPEKNSPPLRALPKDALFFPFHFNVSGIFLHILVQVSRAETPHGSHSILLCQAHFLVHIYAFDMHLLPTLFIDGCVPMGNGWGLGRKAGVTTGRDM